MKLIVGLGNPGKDYQNTRHNIGFNFLDSYVEYKNLGNDWTKKFDGLYMNTIIDGHKVIFLKPQTYMNLSGDCVGKVARYYDISIDDILVISDDMDLLIGNYKLKQKGSSGGHNGLKDIELKLSSSSFKRLKIGISKTSDKNKKDYVLGTFSEEEKKILTSLFQELFLVLDDYFSLPFSDLMSKYNRKNR